MPSTIVTITHIRWYLSKKGNLCENYSAFSKTKGKIVVECHESVRKEEKRDFVMLQPCFAIIHGLAWHTEKVDLALIMKTYIILHNMIVEDENDLYRLPSNYEHVEGSTLRHMHVSNPTWLKKYESEKWLDKDNQDNCYLVFLVELFYCSFSFSSRMFTS